MSKHTNGAAPVIENPRDRTGYDAADPILARAAEESGLAAEYPNDKALLRHYIRKLLVRGWAGIVTATERKYIMLVHRAEGKYQGQRAALARSRDAKAGLTVEPESILAQGLCPLGTRLAPKPTPDTHPAKTGAVK